MIVLVLNAGSSSLKYQVAQAETATVLMSGLVERIGTPDARMSVVTGGKRISRTANAPSHGAALELIFRTVVDSEIGVLGQVSEIDAVGHRVLHSGHAFDDSTLITEEVLRELERHDDLAPLHNPYNVLGVREAMRLLPDVPHVAVFDSTFFGKMPDHAAYYALPVEYAEDQKVRRHGIHGTSYRYVTREIARLLDRPAEQLRMIVCHLGSGSSVTAVEHGTAVDTSAGLTPLEGLVMGTRSGDVDAGVVFFLIRRCGLGVDEVEALLNRRSGMLGVSGVSNDMRDVLEHAERGNERCRLAADMYVYRIKKYIGAYAAAMGGVDVLAFTGGIGEHAAVIRSSICADMTWLGIRLDETSNAAGRSGIRRISAHDSETDVLVVPADEERIIVEDTLRLVGYTADDGAAALRVSKPPARTG
ncbi:acetate/propionate family kinase [Streptomyces blattellae]|uniref:acetate/propionate family kinase n=1 Tax=Streptomyces blattellae TaxID=2569855 RepID=UPI0012B96B7C|nr:acetate kinase [Streptomyces blattellae]